jgi:uncharacterized protein YgiM (DUF1202 family)
MGLREQNISRIAPVSSENVSTSTAETEINANTGTTTEALVEEIIPDEDATSTEEIVTETKIRIKSTPTGWLNVRSGPGTTFALVTKIYPKEEYVVLGQENDWIHLDLSERGDGWVSVTYTEEISN